jgi:bacteriorhodopsin
MPVPTKIQSASTMAALFLRDNDALRTNPPAGDEYLTDGGSNWLWAVFAIFALSFVRLPDINCDSFSVARANQHAHHSLSSSP